MNGSAVIRFGTGHAMAAFKPDIDMARETDARITRPEPTAGNCRDLLAFRASGSRRARSVQAAVVNARVQEEQHCHG